MRGIDNKATLDELLLEIKTITSASDFVLYHKAAIYKDWYNRAGRVVGEIDPDLYEEFQGCYYGDSNSVGLYNYFLLPNSIMEYAKDKDSENAIFHCATVIFNNVFDSLKRQIEILESCKVLF